MTDRNAEFKASKLDQIAAESDKAAAVARRVEAGELGDNGDGTYTVLTGWDAGERLRLSTENGAAQILADHGVDTMADGRVKLYSREQTWYGLGQIVPDGLDSIREVLALIGGELQYSKQVAYYKDLRTGEFKPIPDTFASVWSDPDGKNEAMGAVGKKYTHAQDVLAAEFLLDLIGELVVWESVGRMQNNAKFFAGLRLREDMVIDPQGIADTIRQYLYVINSHDGSGKLTCINTPWRIECGNTERFAVRDALTSWGVRHTKNWSSAERQAEARAALGLTTKYYANWRAEEEELLGYALTGKEIDKFWAVVEGLSEDWTKPEEAKGRSYTFYRNRTDTIEELLGKNMRTLGRNGYAAERAVTEYLDHSITRRTSDTWGGVEVAQARKGIALVGNDDTKKALLHTGLLALARA